jgi:3-dehydroquinate dehydratase/shikimate dehydrogenase
MTLPAVSIGVSSPAGVVEALRRARVAVRAGARLVEWRIDALGGDQGALEAARELLRSAPAPSILTCRRAEEGGEYAGEESTRAEALAELLRGPRPPRYLDIELSTWERGGPPRRLIEEALSAQPARAGTSLILSVHDLRGRPPDLLRRIELMAAEPRCDVIKVAWRARSLRDNLEAFDLLAERPGPMIALCMGPFGLMSRVLAGRFGGLITYVADRPGRETAPGQPTLRELIEVYRAGRIGSGTAVYGVIGWPVAHSLSPALHNAAFEALNHDGVYLPLPVPAAWEHLKATLGALLDHPRLGFRGASVTAPHKENLLRFVRERGGVVEPDADSIGAANTLIVGADGSLRCANTDAPAAVESLRAALSLERGELAGLKVAVLGAGGAARAVVGGLSRAGATIVLINRTRSRAEALADEFHGRPTERGAAAHVVVGRPGAPGCGCFDVLINCTSVGMAGGPAPDRSPLPEGVELGAQTVVFDTVYAPRQTPLLRGAEAAGARTIGGMEMFLRQAAMQVRLWTGRDAPPEVLERAVGGAEGR